MATATKKKAKTVKRTKRTKAKARQQTKDCELVMVLDRSGSMSGCQDATIRGFNEFLSDQKKVPGKASLSMVQFDHEYELIHDGVTLKNVPNLTGATFAPRGTTALLDAIGRTINAMDQRLNGQQKGAKKVLFAILTDGLENASKEFTRDQIFELIRERESKQGWKFVFLGANQDAIASATSLGIAKDAAMDYSGDPAGTRSAYRGLSCSTQSFRTGTGDGGFGN